MISFNVKIVLQVLLGSSVTTRFPTTFHPVGVEPDWANHSGFMVNAQERRGTDGHVFVLVLALDLALAITFILYKTRKANHRSLSATEEHRVAGDKVAS